MSIRYLLILFLTVLLPLLSGCSTESCDEPTDSLVNMTLQFTEESAPSVLDSISLFGLDIPELLYDTTSTNKVLLPLNAALQNVTFIIRKGSVLDTVGLEYTSSVRFISKSCGYTFYYNIERISFTTNSIKNILIINPEINPGDEENLRTFY